MPAERHNPDQLSLPFRIPAKEWFGPREAGVVLGLSERMIEKLYDQGALSGHSHNAGEGKRMTMRIPRAWLVAYAIRTAEYDDASLLDAYLDALRHLPPHALLRVAEAARRLSLSPAPSPAISRQ
ncbi:MAG: hypothetical protein LBK99_23855 [Opitutaceae bacterium]|jgi:hypothetical protein|nr:hypothetical protein [Opitutaceae bacterium]